MGGGNRWEDDVWGKNGIMFYTSLYCTKKGDACDLVIF